MGEQHPQSVTGQPESPLIGVPVEQQGHERVVYFVDEDDADQGLRQYADRPAIKLAGVWRDLDAEEMLRELDRLHGVRREAPAGAAALTRRGALQSPGPARGPSVQPQTSRAQGSPRDRTRAARSHRAAG